MQYLLQNLRAGFIESLHKQPNDHKGRIFAIIDANFGELQQSPKAAVTWLAFWNQSMHSEELARLQRINAARLVSNFKVFS